MIDGCESSRGPASLRADVASFGEHFGLSDTDHTVASRIIRDAVAAKRIKSANPSSRSRKFARYVPFWA